MKFCISLLVICMTWCPSALFGKKIKESKVLICGIAKNVEKSVPATIRSIQAIGDHFADYRVFIYENNSRDETARKFTEWQARNPKVTFISEMLAEEDFYVQEGDKRRKIFRTEILARARNIVLNLAMQPQYDDYEYIIVADLDYGRTWYIEGIMSSFNFEGEWDVITANGRAKRGYWDWYAFRDFRFPFGPELYGPLWWQHIGKWRKTLDFQPGSPYLPVLSAFGGLAIYKRASIKNATYSGTITPDLEELMQMIFDKKDPASFPHILQHQKELEMKRIPTATMPDGKIQWFVDTEMRYRDCPTVCEHVTFHATMIKNGNNKIYVNPKMLVKYWECR